MSAPEIIISNTKEFYITHGDVSTTVTQWANGEGCNVLLQSGRETILHGSVRWEELELLNMATAAVKI